MSVRTAFLLVTVAFGTFAAWMLLGRAAPVTVTMARLEPMDTAPGMARLSLEIAGGEVPDRLLAVSSPDATDARFAGLADAGPFPIPAQSTVMLSSDGVYAVLSGFDGALDEGRLLPIALEFERSGTVSTRAAVSAEVGMHDMHMNHAMHMTLYEGAAPEITMQVEPSEDGTWKVRIATAHFTFDPETPEPVHTPGHGHGHLYLNGLKLQRLYGESATIGELPSGTHQVMVSLNTNTHMAYVAADGVPVRAATIITVE